MSIRENVKGPPALEQVPEANRNRRDAPGSRPLDGLKRLMCMLFGCKKHRVTPEGRMVPIIDHDRRGWWLRCHRCQRRMTRKVAWKNTGISFSEFGP